MKGYLMFILLFMLAGCKTEDNPVLLLKNASSATIYYLISENEVPSSSEVAQVRPITSGRYSEIKIANENREEARTIKYKLYRHRIERDSTEVLSHPESSGSLKQEPVERMIKDRYHSALHVFVITENDKHIRIVRPEDVQGGSFNVGIFLVMEQDVGHEFYF